MKKFDVIAAVLVIIGAVNWGLAGVFQALTWKSIQRRWYSDVAPARA